jgi:predicted GNAT family acetyltransferase
MKVIRYPTAREFLDAAEPFLLRAEVENSLILGIAHELLIDDSGLAITPYLGVVRDDDGICVAALRTLRTKLGITRATRNDALAVLAADVQSVAPTLLGVLGPEPSARLFADELAALRGARVMRTVSQRIFELREVIPPPSPPRGELRQARADEAELLAGWISGFLSEVREVGDSEALVAERLQRGRLYVWDDDGPRTMAAWAGKTPHGVRVNFVYTPPESRGKGYASACVAALSQQLLDEGNDFCCLYTDLSNPISNSIYQKLGYHPVSDAGFYRLIDRPRRCRV